MQIMVDFVQKTKLWPALFFFLAVTISVGHSYITDRDFMCNFEKPICRWRWNVTGSFKPISGEQAKEAYKATGKYSGPFVDSDNNTKGHYLHVKVVPGMKEVHTWSSRLSQTQRTCKIRFWLHMINMTDGVFRVVADSQNPWVVSDFFGNNQNKWIQYEVIIGRIKQPFRLVLEASPSSTLPAYISIDNIRLQECFPIPPTQVECTDQHFHCSNVTRDYCINKTQICDIHRDCMSGADEQQGCDAVPEIARCDFQMGWCGWGNADNTPIKWTRQNGSGYVPRLSGPAYDHTYQNESGLLLYANMSVPRTILGAAAVLESPRFNPPPRYHSNPKSSYYRSCNVRFFYHQSGRYSGSVALFLVELHPSGDRSTRLFYTFGEKGEAWQREVVALPINITQSYYLQFEARKGLKSGGDVALDDITLSPHCFGLNVPEKEKEGYDYESFTAYTEPPKPVEIHADFVKKPVYVITTCGAKGRTGPTPENCSKEYNNTNTEISVIQDGPLKGIQKWIIPAANFYTIIAKGAGGGKGSDGRGSSKGAIAIGIVELKKADSLYILVGQEGNGGCLWNMASNKHYTCGNVNIRNNRSRDLSLDPLTKLKRLVLKQNGGGGGGGSFVYQLKKGQSRVPLVVGSGGGGLASGKNKDDTEQHGKGIDPTRAGITGSEYGVNPPGAGGGWNDPNGTTREVTGKALMQGAVGGNSCGESNGFHGMGGFGGGGGGCSSGGGGGGYAGGSASSEWNTGRGGYSYVALQMINRRVIEGENAGHGSVIIIPAVKGCGCSHLCAAVDEYREHVKCICPVGWRLLEDEVTCYFDERPQPMFNEKTMYLFMGVFAMTTICLTLYVIIRCCIGRKGRRRRGDAEEPGFQLHRLRVTSDSIMTENNPNYEFGGGTCTVRDLIEVPREQVKLVKALGQGAFGEVYQGIYKRRNGEADTQVAIKTLPALSSSQAESDFIMEALIMSKFNHPNIVKFIGVCFEKHPRFIVLELLAGGDLKNFLRESRPKPDNPSSLTMKDLLELSMDIAKGCAYLEEQRFIHRDIAARNCLLTCKGPGRQVKIADFGMARDIYRSDYYRKAGRAMLPVKWMPPEAFQDGIFTTKTDVWSFGILLWEVMSLGYMPYTGCGNREVMQLVVRGGRLEPPINCPPQVYAIMAICWHPRPQERPGFNLIIERIGYCLQDPDILSTELPIFNHTPTSERDATIMRPEEAEAEEAEPSRDEPDYMEPNPGTSKRFFDWFICTGHNE